MLVTDEATEGPRDLSTVAVEAYAARSGYAPIAANCDIPAPAAAGNIVVSFPAGSFSGGPGHYTCHVIATDTGEVQTVAEIEFTIHRSLKPYAECLRAMTGKTFIANRHQIAISFDPVGRDCRRHFVLDSPLP